MNVAGLTPPDGLGPCPFPAEHKVRFHRTDELIAQDHWVPVLYIPIDHQGVRT